MAVFDKDLNAHVVAVRGALPDGSAVLREIGGPPLEDANVFDNFLIPLGTTLFQEVRHWTGRLFSSSSKAPEDRART